MGKVLADPGLIPGAIEEMLRLNPPSQYQGRFTTRDVELEGRHHPGRLADAAGYRRRHP